MPGMGPVGPVGGREGQARRTERGGRSQVVGCGAVPNRLGSAGVAVRERLREGWRAGGPKAGKAGRDCIDWLGLAGQAACGGRAAQRAREPPSSQCSVDSGG